MDQVGTKLAPSWPQLAPSWPNAHLIAYTCGKQKNKAASQTLAGAEQDLEKVEKARAKEMESITMQMSMLAYASLDIFAEKAQTTPDYVVFDKKKKLEKQGKVPEQEEEE